MVCKNCQKDMATTVESALGGAREWSVREETNWHRFNADLRNAALSGWNVHLIDYRDAKWIAILWKVATT